MRHIGHEACIRLCYEFPDQMRGLLIFASLFFVQTGFTHTLVLFKEELQLFLLEVSKDLEGNDECDYSHDP